MTKEILDENVCQVTVTENTVVFLQSRSSIYIFAFFFCVYYHFVFMEPFPNVFEVRSLKWPVTIKNFALGL